MDARVEPGHDAVSSASPSLGVVKDDAERVAAPGAQAADAVAHVDAIDAARALHRPVVHREDHASPCASGTTSARDCMRGRCSVSTNSPPVKSRPGSRQQDGRPAAGRRARRRGPGAGSCSRRRRIAAAAASAGSARPRGSAREIRHDRPDSAIAIAHRLVPAVGDLGERRIERGAQRRDQRRQRIGEVLVLAAPEAVARHDHAAAERLVRRIESRRARRTRPPAAARRSWRSRGRRARPIAGQSSAAIRAAMRSATGSDVGSRRAVRGLATAGSVVSARRLDRRSAPPRPPKSCRLGRLWLVSNRGRCLPSVAEQRHELRPVGLRQRRLEQRRHVGAQMGRIAGPNSVTSTPGSCRANR